MKTKVSITILLFFIILVLGCVNPFAPRLVNNMEGADLVVTAQKTPDEVLQNFKIAYTFRDSLLYSDILDSNFVFYYFEPDLGTSGEIVKWHKDEDLYITGRLFRHFQIVDLIWNSDLYEWSDEQTGQISRSFSLTLIGEDEDHKISGRATFSLRKGADDRWRVTEWRDDSDI